MNQYGFNQANQANQTFAAVPPQATVPVQPAQPPSVPPSFSSSGRRVNKQTWLRIWANNGHENRMRWVREMLEERRRLEASRKQKPSIMYRALHELVTPEMWAEAETGFSAGPPLTAPISVPAPGFLAGPVPFPPFVPRRVAAPAPAPSFVPWSTNTPGYGTGVPLQMPMVGGYQQQPPPPVPTFPSVPPQAQGNVVPARRRRRRHEMDDENLENQEPQPKRQRLLAPASTASGPLLASGPAFASGPALAQPMAGHVPGLHSGPMSPLLVAPPPAVPPPAVPSPAVPPPGSLPPATQDFVDLTLDGDEENETLHRPTPYNGEQAAVAVGDLTGSTEEIEELERQFLNLPEEQEPAFSEAAESEPFTTSADEDTDDEDLSEAEVAAYRDRLYRLAEGGEEQQQRQDDLANGHGLVPPVGEAPAQNVQTRGPDPELETSLERFQREFAQTDEPQQQETDDGEMTAVEKMAHWYEREKKRGLLALFKIM
ncbi:hypothetical protein V8F20_007086 [Naviculisporaceae sp. PSN 640]